MAERFGTPKQLGFRFHRTLRPEEVAHLAEILAARLPSGFMTLGELRKKLSRYTDTERR